MGRKVTLKVSHRGAWSTDEDQILVSYIKTHGVGKWSNIARKTGLNRSGKSCRLRWLNYLHPDVKRGDITEEEEDLIIRLHKLLGNRWSLIAGRLPGRTDNEIKNYWNTILKKKLQHVKYDSLKTSNVEEFNNGEYNNLKDKEPQLMNNEVVQNYRWNNLLPTVDSNSCSLCDNEEIVENWIVSGSSQPCYAWDLVCGLFDK